jgi:hypothetical protein
MTRKKNGYLGNLTAGSWERAELIIRGQDGKFQADAEPIARFGLIHRTSFDPSEPPRLIKKKDSTH